MKAVEKVNYGDKNELHFRNNFSLFENDFRIKQFENQNFIVPWQMVKIQKKEVLVE